MATFRMKDPETWLPTWAKAKNLPALKVRIKDRTYDIPLDKQHGGYEITVTDKYDIEILTADTRFDKIA